MALLDDMKVALRVSGDAFDGEVAALIAAAEADLVRVGVPDAYVREEGPLVRQAVACYCKARFGFDNDEAPRLEASYRQMAVDMANSASLYEGGSE